MAAPPDHGAGFRNDDRYRRIVETAHNGIWEIAADGTTLYVNPRMAEMLGVTVDEMLGRSTFDFVFPEDVEKGLVYFDLRRGGDRGTFEWRFRRADGSELWTLASCHGLLDDAGEFLGAAGIFSDLTAQRETEERLRASETELRRQHNLLEAVLDSTSDVVFVKDVEGRYLMVNRELTTLAQRPAEQLLGRPDSNLFPGQSDEMLERIKDDDRRAMALPAGQFLRFEEEVFAPDGPRHFLTTKAPYHGADGQVLGVIGIARDITERKLTEDALREADRRKDEFLAMLAHELRNPLAPLRNSAEILRLLGGEEPLMTQARETIERQVTHMSRLLDDLLDVSRVARGKIHLRREPCDLARIVRQTAEDYRGTLEKGGLRLDLRLPAGPLWVAGDPIRLAQVVSNVLHNAGKFTQRGGGVTVTLAVTFAAGPEGVADLRIHDTGIGMEPEMIARAFDTFSQADGGLARSRGGLGLGLALVRGLVELHGGAVAASSPGPGQGTEIAIRLPLEPTPLGQPLGQPG